MPRALLLFVLLFALGCHPVLAINLRFAPVSPPKPTKTPSRNGTNTWDDDLKRRQVTSILTVCGYYEGDPIKSRTADPGYGCREDIDRGLWGFCPTTVMLAKDCGLAGNCVDSHYCSLGCGKTGITGLTTFSCEKDRFCSTVILEGGFEGGFSYIACGAAATVETLLKEPTVATVPSITVTSEAPSSASDTTIRSVASPSATQTTLPPSQITSPGDGTKSSEGSSNTGAIVGGVVGGVAIICVTVIVAICIMRRKKRTGEPQGKRRSRFRSWGRSSSKPPNYELSEALQTDTNEDNTEHNKMYVGRGPSEVYGSEPRRDPPAPVELPGASPVELPRSRG
ncbi:hypothetical protein CORC01_09413 [Colletotrichum orchidophilum]|uniref:Uncharacterized protein n=1 Tax=Colletotrichum orchidophilum TaxID=1209926 RepID=A0A1G4B1G7_9PEZI|nr:uncharacterized protein CORC01_09413 [Colletotrichum orchidophilum]OHE95268.1 hypothetical protein CORC01_09413 [Colletotrichum orchidophilum]